MSYLFPENGNLCTCGVECFGQVQIETTDTSNWRAAVTVHCLGMLTIRGRVGSYMNAERHSNCGRARSLSLLLIPFSPLDIFSSLNLNHLSTHS